MAAAIAQAGDPDRAEALARTITEPYYEARALADVAAAIAQAGDPDRAEALARTITSPDARALALAEVAAAIAQAGDPDRAEAIARAITDVVESDLAAILRAAVAEAKNTDRPEALSRPHNQAQALAYLATTIAHTGDLNRARRLMARALIMDPLDNWWVKTVPHLFPSGVGTALDILVDAYARRA